MSHAFADCKWCHGKGCNQCHIERAKVAEKLPGLIATFSTEDIAKYPDIVKQAIGKDALVKAFGPDGGGVHEVAVNSAVAELLLLMRNREDGDL